MCFVHVCFSVTRASLTYVPHTLVFVPHLLVSVPHPLVSLPHPLVLQVANLQNGVCTASPANSINALQLTLPSSSGQGGEEVAGDNDTSSTMGGATPTLSNIPGSCNAEGAQTQIIVSVFHKSCFGHCNE